jgi:hypothetical protein
MTITLTGRPKIEVTESCGKLDLKGKMMLWTYLDLQGKPHLLVPEPILPPPDPHPFPSPNTPIFTGHSARGLDASGISRPTIVLICGTFVLMFCGTYCGLILICLLIQ